MDLAERLEALPWRRLAAGLAVLAALGALAGFAVSVRARPQAMLVPTDAQARDEPRASAPARRLLMVHVAGAVRTPGVYRVEDASRVDDAIRAAGGAAPDADLDSLNLAARVRDGDKIVVARRAPPGAAAQASAGAPAGAKSAKVNLNTASVSELDALPGIGPALAQRILAYREQKGAFRAVRDLMQVPGIGPSKFESLEDLVTV